LQLQVLTSDTCAPAQARTDTCSNSAVIQAQ
jgi:hypothetical protein